MIRRAAAERDRENSRCQSLNGGRGDEGLALASAQISCAVRKDGRPHVVPVWFVMDGEDLVFTTSATSVKARAMRRDPRASLCVDSEDPPYAFVTVEGVAALSNDVDEMVPYATAIGARYMGAERAEEFGRRNAVQGELLVRVTPTSVLAEDDITG